MQSFKQFLKENEYSETTLAFFWRTDSPINNETAERLLTPVLENLEFTAKCFLSPRIVNIYIEKLGDITQSYIDELYSKIEGVLGTNNSTNHRSIYHISIKGLPEHTINTPNTTVLMNCFGPTVYTNTLSGLDKKILACEFFQLTGSEAIEKNVLSILRLKAKKIYLIDDDNIRGRKIKWAEIVNKHLEDRDILQCQEDLIDAGLKDFAKL